MRRNGTIAQRRQIMWKYVSKDGETKTKASDGFVPLHPILAGELRAWQAQTPYGKKKI